MSSGVIRDIQHGEKYREVGSFLSHLGNLTLLMNTDGVQIFKLSSVSIWPIWVVINELPPPLRYKCTFTIIILNWSCYMHYFTLRFSKSNMILVGLWCTKEKPSTNAFLRLTQQMSCIITVFKCITCCWSLNVMHTIISLCRDTR